MKRIAVIGDVHAQVALARDYLLHTEEVRGPIDWVFSVGDFGLFLKEEDWRWLAGPKHHRHPEWSADIAGAWESWKWGFSMIGGNHEPYHLLRDGGIPRVNYTDAGWLDHGIAGLRVAGLSGIYHPEHLEFGWDENRRKRFRSWKELARGVTSFQASIKRLNYYKQRELDLLAPLRPHLMLTHDWNTTPAGVTDLPRPEAALIESMKPDFLCCGHHHRTLEYQSGSTQVYAMNLLRVSQGPECGWIRTFLWDDCRLRPETA